MVLVPSLLLVEALLDVNISEFSSVLNEMTVYELVWCRKWKGKEAIEIEKNGK